MRGHEARREIRAAWLVSVAGSLLLAGSALGQHKGDDKQRGPAVQPAPAARPTPPPQAAPPRAAPPVRMATPTPQVRPAAPPAAPPVIRQAAPPKAAPVAPPVIRQSAPPPSKPAAIPTAPPVLRQAPPATKPAAPPVLRTTPPTMPSSGSNVGGGQGVIRQSTTGIRKEPHAIASVPTQSWTGGKTAGANPGTGGVKPPRDPGPRDHASGPDKPGTKGLTPWTGAGDKHKSDTRGGGLAAGIPDAPPVLKYQPHTGASPANPFDKPLTQGGAVGSISPGTPRHGGGLNYTPPMPHNPPASDNLRLSVNVGVGAGIGFSASERFGHTWINFSFNNWCGDYSPYAYPGYSWCRPRYYRACGFDPYRHCNPWGGFYYVRRWPYYPFTYWYPGYTVSVNACGPWFRISYHRPLCGWLTEFRYCSTPCDTFADVALVSSAVVVSTAIPVYALSTENTYRYTYVNPVMCDEVPSSPPTPVAEILPAPASAAELDHTTGRDLGDTYMRLGDGPSAMRVYNAHVMAHPGDVRAIRSMGVAMIEAGEVERGAAAVERSYLIDPSLASKPFDRELLRDANSLTAVLDRATELAGRMDGKPQAASAWLTVSVLMQADGRVAPARAALDKAKAAGLNERVVEEMQAALPNQ